MSDRDFIEAVLQTGVELAIRGGREALRHLERGPDVHLKADSSPVTAADIAVDTILYEGLTAAFPDVPVVTEERAESHGLPEGDGFWFLVDPIDGTREFIDGNGEFTVNIALVRASRPVAGIVGVPVRGKVYFGAEGLGAFESDVEQFERIGQSGQSISVAPADAAHLRLASSRSHANARTAAFLAANPHDETVIAGSSLKFCLLAKGAVDLYPRLSPTMEWDTAAGHAIVLAAGGEVITPDGKPLAYGKPGFRNGDFIARAPGVAFTMPGE